MSNVEARKRSMYNRAGYVAKDVANAGAPEWARGCEKCRYGILRNDIPSGGAIPLYLQRVVQLKEHYVFLCDCEAGRHARAYYASVWLKAQADASLLTGDDYRAAVEWTETHKPALTVNGVDYAHA